MQNTNVSDRKQLTPLQNFTRDLADAVTQARERLDERAWEAWVETGGCLFDRLRVDSAARRWTA